MEHNLYEAQRAFSGYAYVVPTHDLEEIPLKHGDIEGLSWQLVAFMEQVKSKYPHLSFLYMDDDHNNKRSRIAYVYMPGQLFTMGAIGHGDFRISDYRDGGLTARTSNRYYVWGPHIKDLRVESQCNARYATTSDTLDKAVDKVKRLRPLTNLGYLSVSGHTMLARYESAMRKAHKLVESAKSNITHSPSVYWDDLFNAYKHAKRGLKYEYSPQLVEKFEEYIYKTNESVELLAKRSDYVAQVIPMGDYWEVNKIKIDFTSYKYGIKHEVEYYPIEEFTDETLPRDIASKVSMLDMLQRDENEWDIDFVLGVGMTALKRQMYYVVL